MIFNHPCCHGNDSILALNLINNISYKYILCLPNFALYLQRVLKNTLMNANDPQPLKLSSACLRAQYALNLGESREVTREQHKRRAC